MSGLRLVTPAWPAPPGVRACCTTRAGGVSEGPYTSFNLATHVGDAPEAVAANRARLGAALGFARAPCWLVQVHGTRVVRAEQAAAGTEADAAFTGALGVPCVVLTADCLPILLCDAAGAFVGAVHAGWRGLLDGVIPAAVDALRAAGAGDLLAWIGPGIGPEAYEVGTELRERFLRADARHEPHFRRSGARWHANLPGLAGAALEAAGAGRIYRYEGCTFGEPARFYSFRRDGATGRMASLIWRDAS